MFLKGLECPVSKLDNRDTRPHAACGDSGFTAPRLQETPVLNWSLAALDGSTLRQGDEAPAGPLRHSQPARVYQT